ncbi:dihydropteroate synthase [Glycomyces sp. L485]|uniref:dihydropteroate synthase n=1 Tax=Glycomyces sp. L485 TaxID=2909235 RepID=UPI001F4ACA7E|nr:dihydropteroate synthase [Glycomyces sp. L485]MCH7232461.1 dihydropteroate synthase [Glycomyces sp. L485]
MRALKLGRRTFGEGDYAVMAIVNRTPDSFYDSGATFEFDAALAAVASAVANGADIVDIGGVKAGEGPEVSVAEEIERVVPFVGAVHDAHPELVISIDTWRSEVAREAVAAGAELVNDTWAGWDPGVVKVAADTGVGLVCSHTGGLEPRTVASKPVYSDVVAEVRAELIGRAEAAVEAGVRADGVLIDPTHDFGKTTYHSLDLTHRLDEITETGWPVLVALSRKDFVGETLDLPVDRRLNGTLAATAVSAWLGARVFRAHDVAATREVLDMVASIKGSRPPKNPHRSL